MSDGPASARPHAPEPAMLPGSSLNSFEIKSSDRKLGVISDFLFDDASWSVRWMVAHTGDGLNRRTVSIRSVAAVVGSHVRDTDGLIEPE